MYLYKGDRIDIGIDLVIDGVQYPAGYFNDPVVRGDFGITEATDPVYPNPDFYYWTPGPNGTLVITP